MRGGVILASLLAATPLFAEQKPDVRILFDEIVLTYSLADLVVVECSELEFSPTADVLIYPEIHAQLAAQGYDVTPLLAERSAPDSDAVLGHLIEWLQERGQTDLATVDACAAAQQDMAQGTRLGQLLVRVE